jgi:hypothetical protein
VWLSEVGFPHVKGFGEHISWSYGIPLLIIIVAGYIASLPLVELQFGHSTIALASMVLPLFLDKPPQGSLNCRVGYAHTIHSNILMVGHITSNKNTQSILVIYEIVSRDVPVNIIATAAAKKMGNAVSMDFNS